MFLLGIDTVQEVMALLEEGVIVINAKRQVERVNTAAAVLLKISKQELVGQCLTVHGCKILKRASALLFKAREQGRPAMETLTLSEKGSVEMIASFPKGKKGILILRDRKNMQKVVEMGRAFVANASHELRTPITIIKGFAETLQDLPEISHQMLGDITEKIVRNCQRMENLVKGLLTLADLENIPENRFQLCDVRALVDNCIHLLQPLYPQAVVTIEDVDELDVWADPDILELAIFNLMENAAKYSSQTPHITVILSLQEKGPTIAIQDQGIGMSEGDLERIFDRFYTVDKARSRKLGGAGIGLSIVQTIVQKLGGTIAVESTLGKGTTFTLSFPSMQGSLRNH